MLAQSGGVTSESQAAEFGLFFGAIMSWTDGYPNFKL